jgi:transcriptional regulator GlxA family with amidase domain
MTLTVAIFLYPNVEVLDFAGPYEVFTTASRLHARHHPKDDPLFDVFTVAQSEWVRARAGLQVKADHLIGNHPAIDLLVIPGGVVDEELNKQEVLDWIQTCAGQTRITASVCTGAFLLAKLGLLDGKQATTHWEDTGILQDSFPKVQVVEDRRWVDLGSVVTSAGISAGIDMSLHLVEKLYGRSLALATAKLMDVVWTEDTTVS